MLKGKTLSLPVLQHPEFQITTDEIQEKKIARAAAI